MAPNNQRNIHISHCVKSVRIRSYSGPYFPAFELNTERYGVSLRIQSECEKIRTRITPNTDTFHAVPVDVLSTSLPLQQGNLYDLQYQNFFIKVLNFSQLLTELCCSHNFCSYKKEWAKFGGSRAIVGLVGHRAIVPSWIFRGLKIFSRGYLVSPKLFLVGILYDPKFFSRVFFGPKVFYRGFKIFSP